MRVSRIRFGLALLLATSPFGFPILAQAAPQWSGITGRAVLESFMLAPSLTNFAGRPPVYSASNYVAVRSPIKTTIRVYAAKSGRLVRTVNTDDSGGFVALLQPGLYRLEPAIIQDGQILGPGVPTSLKLTGVIQTAPVQVVRVGGFRYSQVTVVYHTAWSPIRYIPSRPTRTVPVTGPIGNVPLPQPARRIESSGASALLTGRTLPPLPPSPYAPPDSPVSVLQPPLSIPQRAR